MVRVECAHRSSKRNHWDVYRAGAKYEWSVQIRRGNVFVPPTNEGGKHWYAVSRAYLPSSLKPTDHRPFLPYSQDTESAVSTTGGLLLRV